MYVGKNGTKNGRCEHLSVSPLWMKEEEQLTVNRTLVNSPRCLLKATVGPWLVKAIRSCFQFTSVQSLSHVHLLVTPWAVAHQASLSITKSWSWLKLMSIESVMPSNHLIPCCPLLLLPSIFPSIRVFSKELVLCIRCLRYAILASASVLPMNTRDWFPLGWTGWISPRDSQESCPTPQFKSINFSVLSFLHSPTLTSIHDHWKNHSLD